MRSTFLRVLGALALAAIVSPSFASAADLTPAQRGSVTKMTNAYFHALVTDDTDTLTTMTTPDFKATPLKGSGTVSISALANQYAVAKLQISGVTGGAKVMSATGDGTTTVAMVAVQATGNTLAGGNGQMSVSRNATHTMTWVKTANGWKLSSDIVSKRHTMM